MNNNATFPNAEKVANNSAILFSTLSIGAWLFIIGLLYLYSKKKSQSWGIPANLGIMFFTFLVTFVADFTVNQGLPTTFNVYMFVKTSIIGVLTFIIGTKSLFVYPKDSIKKPIGYHHNNLSFIIWHITLLLVVMEFIQTTLLSNQSIIDHFHTAVDINAMIQKLIQGWMYHFLICRKIPKKEKELGVSWFFKLMSLFNFSQWIQSIIEAETGEKGLVLSGNIKNIYEAFKSAYYAIMIDYRLLFCLLFLEHAHEIDGDEDSTQDHTLKESHQNDSEHVYSTPDMSENSSTWMLRLNINEEYFFKGSVIQKFGILTGLIFAGIQFVAIKEIPYLNFLGIFVDVIVVVLGVLLITQVRSKSTQRDTSSKGVDLMVGLMGVTGLAFWFFKTLLLFTWTETVSPKDLSKFHWNIAKSAVRAVSCLFSIYLYMRSDHLFGTKREIKFRLINHFLIPCLMISYLAVFINSVIDSFDYKIKKTMKSSHLSIILFAMYEAGIPIHLGFCLHMALHFYFMFCEMRSSFKESRNVYRESMGQSTKSNHIIIKENEYADDGGDIFGGRSDLMVGLLDEKAQNFKTY